VYQLDSALAEFLMRDSPGSFEIETEPEPVAKELEKPTVDKMVRRPTRKK